MISTLMRLEKNKALKDTPYMDTYGINSVKRHILSLHLSLPPPERNSRAIWFSRVCCDNSFVPGFWGTLRILPKLQASHQLFGIGKYHCKLLSHSSMLLSSKSPGVRLTATVDASREVLPFVYGAFAKYHVNSQSEFANSAQFANSCPN
jgi:hypothetical protein